MTHLQHLLTALTPFLPLIASATALLAVLVGPAVTAWLTQRQISAARLTTERQLAATKRLADDQIAWERRAANKHAVAPMRQAWINALREKVACFLALAARLSGSLADIQISDVVQFAQTQFEILLMLNPKEADHQELERLIEELAIYTHEQSQKVEAYWDYRLRIVKISRAILKREWDRIKSEDAN